MISSVTLPGGAVLRPLAVDDAPALHEAYLRNRDHLRPFEPVRPDSFWTVEGQRARLESLVQRSLDGAMLACGIVLDGRVLGTMTINSIVLGPFCSASLGYWIDAQQTGKGLATATVAAICRIGDEELGLHRLEASTLPSNVASQRVLVKNGFEQFGTADRYQHIAGHWTDARLFQRILNDRPPIML